jgi:hypothetical protein
MLNAAIELIHKQDKTKSSATTYSAKTKGYVSQMASGGHSLKYIKAVFDIKTFSSIATGSKNVSAIRLSCVTSFYLSP